MSTSEGREIEREETDVRTEENQVDVRNDDRPPEAQSRQPTKLESFMAITKSLIVRALIFYFITSFLRRPTAPAEPVKGGVAPRGPSANAFPDGTLYDMRCYVSEDEHFSDFSDESALLWLKTDLVYGDWLSGEDGDGSYRFDATIKTSASLRNNGSIYLHVYLTKSGTSPDPTSGKESHSARHTSYARKRLNRFKKLKYLKTHNLLTGETQKSPEEILKAETTKEEIVSHWHPNLTVNIITDQTNWMQGSVPPPLDEFVYFSPDGKTYKPPVYINDYWNMIRDYFPINETVHELELRLTVRPLSLFKWQMYAAHAMRDKLGMFASLGASEQDEEQDAVKELLLDTSPYLVALTIVVSVLHSVFELLAFKNDIQFWNERKSLEGLSVRSVFFNVFQSAIVLLYILDNEANTMVLISCFVGMLIEVWKINKVVRVEIRREEKILGVLPKISFEDKGSYVASSTNEYDQLAFRYLPRVCFPLLVGYGIYSLLYNEHKGWYSFILNMLYGYLLTFGFIMMTPQLFINYKLKSVAHLPWRMMSYKFLNTFIDDIFAFVIKMPTMYRLGCFRDDIVFFIFLYQRWIYKVDHTRVNEFGFSGEMENGTKEERPSIEDKPQLSKKNE